MPRPIAFFFVSLSFAMIPPVVCLGGRDQLNWRELFNLSPFPEDPKDGEEESGGRESSGRISLKVSKEEAQELNELRTPSPLELDSSKPRFISRDIPAFAMIRPPAIRKKQAKNFLDGSRWGFVDFAMRKRRIETWYDKYMALLQKKMDDEKAPEEERNLARKQFVFLRAQKAKRLRELEKIRCQVELVGKENVFLQLTSQDRPPGQSEKALREQMTEFLGRSGYKVVSEKPESAWGSRVPAYTFFAEGRGSGGGEDFWIRQTYVLVPKPRRRGVSIVTFFCQAPKSQIDDQMKREFEAFILGTRF